jgi:hypothetical protein
MNRTLYFTHKRNILGSVERKPIKKDLMLRDTGKHCMPFMFCDISTYN